MTRPTDPPQASNRFFTEKSPRWVWQPSLGGFFGIIALMVLHLLPEATHPYLAWGMALVPPVAMGLLVSGWRKRLPVSAWELEYLRVGIVLLTICGLGALSGGALPLSLVAGPAFFAWTIVENRRTPGR